MHESLECHHVLVVALLLGVCYVFFLFHYSYILVHSAGECSGEIDEAAREWEHALMQSTMDKELNELNKRLEQKEVAFMGLVL